MGMNRTPMDALSRGGSAKPAIIRGVVTAVNLDPAGQLAFTFSVLPDIATFSTGSDNRELTDVILLQPAFGSLADLSSPPTGVTVSPVVGSRVACAYDGVRWVIIGCYTGPMATPLEQGGDYERRQIGFNPGIELALHRLAGIPGLDLPAIFGYEAGDIVFGKGTSRLKVSSLGTLIAASPTCMRLYKADGVVLEYCAQMELRALGWWYRTSYQQGNDAVSASNLAAPHLVPPAADGSAYQCEILESGVLETAMAPYLVRRTGHVSRGFASMGRSAIYAAATPQTVAEELASGKFAVLHDTVVSPNAPSVEGTDELDTTACAKHDLQVDADGSFRLRAGNLGDIPGGQTDAPTQQLDFSFEYDAKAQEFLLRVGAAGVEGTTVRISGRTPADAKAVVETGTLEAKARLTATLEAKTKITLRAPLIELDGAVRMTQTALIQGIMTALQDVLVARSVVTPILASGTPVTGPVPVPMTMQGGLMVTGPITSDTAVIAAPAGAPPVTLGTHTHLYAPGPGSPVPTAPGVG